METELKLSFPAGSRAQIDRVLRARDLPPSRPGQQTDSIYFDTPDLALCEGGYSLRIRQIGRAYTQTVKSLIPSGGPAARRFEAEWRVAGGAPDVGLLNETPAAFLIPSGCLPRLTPIFESRINRTVHEVRFGACVIELAIDEGEILAGLVAAPVHELELELKEGPLELLYRFALELQAELPLTIAAESKAERGFRLRCHRAPPSSKARPLSLEPNVTIRDGMRLIIENGLAQLVANLPAISLNGDGEGVHQARVALRRLRSAFTLFAFCLDRRAAIRFEEELRRLGRLFGTARDWDVLVLETIPRASAEGMDGDWLRSLLRPSQALRRDAYQSLAGVIASQELTGFVLALAAWSSGRFWVGAPREDAPDIAAAPLRDLAPRMLDRLEAKISKRARHLERQNADDLHTLRKSFKKLRYGVEFFAGLYGHKSVKRYRQPCEGVQEVLGAINDTVATESLIGRIADDPGNAGLAPSIGIMTRWVSHNRRSAMAHLPAAWDGFQRNEPFWRSQHD